MGYKKEQFIGDLKIGDMVDTSFIVSVKKVKKKKNGEDYCTLTLQDSSGTLEGVMWTEAFHNAKGFAEGDLVAVKGMVKEYRGVNQLIVDSVNKLGKDNADLSDYIRSSSQDIDKMFESILGYIDSIENKYLKKLLKLFFDDKEFADLYRTSTAAVKYHHAYQGGLLEHSLNVVRICDKMTVIYDNLNRDLLIAGAVLHDIGKIEEYSSDVNLKITNRGRLLGHITIGYGWVQERIRKIKGFPDDLSDRLLHIILSHHGRLDFGSPKRPKILEAFIVYHADHLDGDIGGFNIIMENTNDENDWSDYVRNFERPVYVKQLELDETGEKDSGDAGSGTGQDGLF